MGNFSTAIHIHRSNECLLHRAKSQSNQSKVFGEIEMNESILRFEYFPDEIFFEIFKHVPLHDLYHGFYNLNYRINYILHSVNGLPLTLNKPDEINDRVVSFFALRISHLVVRHSKTVHFARFPSLRSLTSLFPNDEQLNCIRSDDLPQLTRLTLGFMAVSDGRIIFDLCERIFSNEFPNLCYCSLWPPAFRNDYPIARTSLITHVQLQEASFDDLCTVLDACPHLKHLQVGLTDVNQLHRFYYCPRINAVDTHLDPSLSIDQSTAQAHWSSVCRTAGCVVHSLRSILAGETCSITSTGTAHQTIDHQDVSPTSGFGSLVSYSSTASRWCDTFPVWHSRCSHAIQSALSPTVRSTFPQNLFRGYSWERHVSMYRIQVMCTRWTKSVEIEKNWILEK